MLQEKSSYLMALWSIPIAKSLQKYQSKVMQIVVTNRSAFFYGIVPDSIQSYDG